ncbi:MAG: flavodoxin domain-containing protein, partial [Bacteroidales bacterium]|nr:flavodoxin domain-containing protein [Bacteroidales bacterium]
VICTGHGAILRKNWKKYVDLSGQYAREALQNPIPNRVFLGFVSAYHNTGIMAEKIAEGLKLAGNIEVDLCDLEKMELKLVEQKIIEASAIILGCPTFSQNILLPVYQVFAFINPIRDRNKLAAAFGSYGWSGDGVRIMNSILNNLKLKVFDEGLMAKFTPHQEFQQLCIDYGRKFGEKMLSNDVERSN